MHSDSSKPPEPSDSAPPAEPRTREYLANERTYLAWMRSAISMIGFGVILTRLRAFQPPLVPSPGTTWQLGIIFTMVGIFTVFLSTQHYLVIRRAIADDSYIATDRWVILLSLSVILLSSGIIYYAFSYAPGLVGNPAP